MSHIQVFTKIIDGRDFVFRRSLDSKTNSPAYSITEVADPSNTYSFKRNQHAEWENQNQSMPGDLGSKLKELISRHEADG